MDITDLLAEHPGLNAVVTAPSAHNSQPWTLRPSSSGVTLGWDTARRLPAGDPSGRYLYVGLGAAAEAIVLGAADKGAEANVVFEGHDHESTASIQYRTGTRSYPNPMLAAMLPVRRTVRRPFETTEVAPAALARLEALGTTQSSLVSFVDTADAVDAAAELVGAGTLANFRDEKVFSEFTEWLRDDRANRQDGLTLDDLGIPRFNQPLVKALLTPEGMERARRFGIDRIAARQVETLARRTPAYGLVTATDWQPSTLFAAGRTTLRVWLDATRLGLSLHPMTAALDHPSTSPPFAAIFDLAPRGAPVLAFRLGYGHPGQTRSRRRSLEEVMIQEADSHAH